MCILQCVWKQNRLETWDTVTWVADSKTSPIGRSPEPCKGRRGRLRPAESGSLLGPPSLSPGAPDPWWSHWVRAPPRPAWGKVASPERKHYKVLEIRSSTSFTLSLTFAIQGHSCEGSTSTLNWNLALAESVIPHSGWMSRTKEWLSTSGGVKPSTASVKMESPCRKCGHDMYTGFPACPSRFRYQIICKYKQKFIQTWCK